MVFSLSLSPFTSKTCSKFFSILVHSFDFDQTVTMNKKPRRFLLTIVFLFDAGIRVTSFNRNWRSLGVNRYPRLPLDGDRRRPTPQLTRTPQKSLLVVHSEHKADVVSNQGDIAFTAEPQEASSSSIAQAIDQEGRWVYPEYDAGQVPRMFSSLDYNTNEHGRVVSADHVSGSVIGAAALITGTTVGAGVLALPASTASAGYLPSSLGLIVAWAFMNMSGLLIAELTLNRMVGTGRPALGLLELYKNSFGSNTSTGGVGSWATSIAYFFLHYAVLVAYLAKGGQDVAAIIPALPTGTGPLAFAAMCGLPLYLAKPSLVEKINNLLVLGVATAFCSIIVIGAGSVDFATLMGPSNQHFEQLAGCFPILFLSIVFHNVVPTVVAQLEGDRTKISQAILAGTSLPLLMFLAFNAVVLGNSMGDAAFADGFDPLVVLQEKATGGGQLLSPLVSVFSFLALVTSVIGFTYGLVDAWTDVFDINSKSLDTEGYKAQLFALVYLPPLALAMANPNTFYQALEYGGAFGVSTLFLLLPASMVWKERYGEEKSPLIATPMVPFGKIALGFMCGAAGTLILQEVMRNMGTLYISQPL